MFGINNSDGNSGPVIAPDPSAMPAGGGAPDPGPAAPPVDAPSAPPMAPSDTSAEPTGYTDATAQFNYPTEAPAPAPDAPAHDVPSHGGPSADPTSDDFTSQHDPNNVILNDIPTPATNDIPAVSSADNPTDSDLMKLKLEALNSLSPLVDQLDQTPEEKFKTTMMMLQASDNPTLVRKAYESANQIGDEKVRAQALLDVVNEINYFTQHNKADTPGEEHKDS